MRKWTEKKIDKFVDDNGGEGFALLDVFPFTDESRAKIKEASEDEDAYTDSELADLIIELAYRDIK